MAFKIDVKSGDPFRDNKGHFGTSPDDKLKESFAKLHATPLVSHEDNKKLIEAAKVDAATKLAALRGEPSVAHLDARPVLTAQERTDAIARFNELNDEIGVYFARDRSNGGLNESEAKAVEALRMEQSDINYKISAPAKPEKVAPESETKSTLSPAVVVAAFNDKLSNKEAYTAIDSAFAGTYFNADTAVDDVMNGKNKKLTPQQFYNTFDNTRAELKKQYGDTIPLYRAEGKQRAKYTKNWATTEAFVKQFGDNIVKKDTPVDQVLAINVFRSGKYHEVIVGKPPVTTKITKEAKGWSPTGTESDAKEFVKNSKIKTPLYHGTDGDSAKSIKSSGFKIGKGGEDLFGSGVYLASDSKVADGYASAKDGGTNLKTYINVEKPFTDSKKFDTLVDEALKKKKIGLDDFSKFKNFAEYKKTLSETADNLFKQGYDAIVIPPPKSKQISGNFVIMRDSKKIMIVDGK